MRQQQASEPSTIQAPTPYTGRTAVCLTGSARDFELTGPSIVARLLPSLRPYRPVLFVVAPLDELSHKLWALQWGLGKGRDGGSGGFGGQGGSGEQGDGLAGGLGRNLKEGVDAESAWEGEVELGAVVMGGSVWVDGDEVVGDSKLYNNATARSMQRHHPSSPPFHRLIHSRPPFFPPVPHSPCAASAALPTASLILPLPYRQLPVPPPLLATLPPSHPLPPRLLLPQLQYLRLLALCLSLIDNYQHHHPSSPPFHRLIHSRLDSYWSASPSLSSAFPPSLPNTTANSLPAGAAGAGAGDATAASEGAAERGESAAVVAKGAKEETISTKNTSVDAESQQQEQEKEKEEEWVVPFGSDYRGFNDAFGVGSLEAARKVLSRLSSIQELVKAGLRPIRNPQFSLFPSPLPPSHTFSPISPFPPHSQTPSSHHPHSNLSPAATLKAHTESTGVHVARADWPLCTVSHQTNLSPEATLKAHAESTGVHVARADWPLCTVSHQTFKHGRQGEVLVASLQSRANLNGAKCWPCTPKYTGLEALSHMAFVPVSNQIRSPSADPVNAGSNSIQLCDTSHPWELAWTDNYDAAAGSRLAGMRRAISQLERPSPAAICVRSLLGKISILQHQTLNWSAPPPSAICLQHQTLNWSAPPPFAICLQHQTPNWSAPPPSAISLQQQTSNWSAPPSAAICRDLSTSPMTQPPFVRGGGGSRLKRRPSPGLRGGGSHTSPRSCQASRCMRCRQPPSTPPLPLLLTSSR
ncbi:unnamed protein product [Closterium sp. Naga37s-1]|nr:unnamed protein product [Closterium sp. Naga37s-1]